MKRIGVLVAFLLFACVSHATTVTGNLTDIVGRPVNSANGLLRFTLENFGSNIPKVSGSRMVATPKAQAKPDDSGVISIDILGNDLISPAGTFYRICIFYQGRQFRCNDYSLAGSTLDLNSASPITVVPTVPAPIGDDTYLRLDGGNKPTGNITPNTDSSQSLGNSGARWEIYGDSASINSLSVNGGAAVTGQTGTGDLVLSTSPSMTSPTVSGASLSGTLSGSPTFSGNPAFSGTPNFTGAVTLGAGGSLTGTFTGHPTLSGNPTFSGSPVFSGSFSGSAIQGSDSKVLSAGTVSGTGSPLCTDGNGGATTSGCSSSGPTVVANVDLTGLTAAQSSTSLYAVPSAGYYRISANFLNHNTGGSSSAISVRVTFTQSGFTMSSIIFATHSTGASSTDTGSGVWYLYPDAGTTIYWDSTLTGTPAYYDLHVRLERVSG